MGLWFENSRTTVAGWTVTLHIDQGNLLLSGLAFLVALAGTSAWSLAAVLLHSRIVRGREDVDAVDFQHQVALRISSSYNFGFHQGSKCLAKG